MSIQRPTKLDFCSSAGALPEHMSWQPRTPPQFECPKTITCATFRDVTAYSSAADVPCCAPSGSCGGTRLAMLRWMKNSPWSAPNIDVTCTRLSQHEIIIAAQIG